MFKINQLTSDWLTLTLNRLDVERTGFRLGLAGLTLGQALQNGNGAITTPAIFLLTASLIFLGYGLDTRQKPMNDVIKKLSIPVLIVGLCLQILQLVYSVPGVFLLPSSTSTFWLFKIGVAIAGCFAIISLAPKTRIPSAWQNVLVGLTLMTIWFLGVWVIKASPNPFIDVFVFQQTSGEALLHGQNPYTLRPPNIYGHMGYYGAELVANGKMTIGNPYPPLSIYFSTLGYLGGGDIRYSHLLATVLSGALIAFLHPGRESKLAAYIFLFTPRVFYVVEQSWTEPIVVLCLTATIFCAFRYPRWLPLMLGLLFASKQYFLFILPLTLLLIPPKSPWRKLVNFYGWMSGVMIVVTAPLAFWNLSAFMWNVGWAQWYQVFRLDALSYPALYAQAFDQAPSQLIGFIALAFAYVFVWRFAPRTPTGFAISVAWCLGIFFAFNKQAFCNYYFLVIGTICCAFASLNFQHQASPEESKVF